MTVITTPCGERIRTSMHAIAERFEGDRGPSASGL
jgi:hypothetical protein